MQGGGNIQVEGQLYGSLLYDLHCIPNVDYNYLKETDDLAILKG